MVAIKSGSSNVKRPLAYKVGVYILCAYWIIIIITYLTVDLFLDLYTTTDFAAVCWYATAISLPVAALTLYYIRKDVFGRWYTYIFSPLIAFGLYLGCTYFSALNIDLLLSAAFKQTNEQILPVKSVKQVFARKIGFIHTDVALTHDGRTVTFEGSRTSFFLLRDKQKLNVSIGLSYLGNYFITSTHIPAQQRWTARYLYIKDWFHRYLWLLIGFPLVIFLGVLKDRFFPRSTPEPKQSSSHPYLKFFKLLLIILLSLFGLFMLALLLIGIFM